MPDGRPDKTLYASMSGANSYSDWDILLADNCVSGQDDFWWSDKKL